MSVPVAQATEWNIDLFTMSAFALRRLRLEQGRESGGTEGQEEHGSASQAAGHISCPASAGAVVVVGSGSGRGRGGAGGHCGRTERGGSGTSADRGGVIVIAVGVV